MQKVVDKGPWSISDWSDGRIAIQSDDFTHDVALEITGDFGDPELKRAHAQRICNCLNDYLHLSTAEQRPVINKMTILKAQGKI